MFLSRLFFVFVTAAMATLALPWGTAIAHELWLEAEEYQVDNGAAIIANIKNGEDFKGNTLSYFDRSAARFDIGTSQEVRPITARAGDRPAITLPAPPTDTLVALLYETTPDSLTYKEWAKFTKFAAHKDFTTALADHVAAGWPQEGFRESYTRHAKALVAVGSGAGADRAYGLVTEFVALTNPYEPGFDGEMQVALSYDTTPRADAQIEVFDRAPDGTVTVTLHRTDASGTARIPVTPGHDYLFDAVVLRPAADAGSTPTAPVWETLWAALTFSVPQ